jgi:hypothetical protein
MQVIPWWGSACVVLHLLENIIPYRMTTIRTSIKTTKCHTSSIFSTIMGSKPCRNDWTHFGLAVFHTMITNQWQLWGITALQSWGWRRRSQEEEVEGGRRQDFRTISRSILMKPLLFYLRSQTASQESGQRLVASCENNSTILAELSSPSDWEWESHNQHTCSMPPLSLHCLLHSTPPPTWMIH